MSMRFLTMAMGVVLAFTPAAMAEHDADAVSRAKQFLESAKMGRMINNYMHFGTTYRSHGDCKVCDVTNQPTQFALLTTFNWESNGAGVTNVHFFFNKNGAFTELRVKDSNAFLQQPFAAANLTIKVLGEALFEGFKDQMTDGDKKVLRWAIDNTETKTLLELNLVLESRLKR